MIEIERIWPEWKIEGSIGQGSFGTVYRAQKNIIGTVAWSAIKVITFPQSESDLKELYYSFMNDAAVETYCEDVIKNLIAEVNIMISLKSTQNIVRIEDYYVHKYPDEMKWDIYIRMEYLESFPNYQKRRASNYFSVEEIIKFGMDIANSLMDCEKANVIHRDIKPDNVFVTGYGNYKLGDFGISKQLDSVQTAKSKQGSDAYMAPEVYRGMSYDKTIDIYSLGIMLYQLLNGMRLPFEPMAPQGMTWNDKIVALERRMNGEKIPRINNYDVDERLNEIILKACAYAPEQRYQSAEEFYRALRNYSDVSERTMDISSMQTAFHRTNSPQKSNKNGIVAAALALFFGALGVQNFYLGNIILGVIALTITLLGWGIGVIAGYYLIGAILIVIPPIWGVLDAIYKLIKFIVDKCRNVNYY